MNSSAQHKTAPPPQKSQGDQTLKDLQTALEQKKVQANHSKATADGLNAEIAGLQGAISDIQKNLEAFRTDGAAMAQQLKDIADFWKMKWDRAKQTLGPKAGDVEKIIQGYADDTKYVQGKIDDLVPKVYGTSQKTALDKEKDRADTQAKYTALQVASLKATIQKLQAQEKEVDGYADKREDLPKMYFLLVLMKEQIDLIVIPPDVKAYEASLVAALEQYTTAVSEAAKAKTAFDNDKADLDTRKKQLQDLQNKRKENILALLKDVSVSAPAKSGAQYQASE